MTSTNTTLEKYRALPIAGITSNEPYAISNEGAGQREQAKVSFIEGEGEWPSVEYPNLSLDEMRQAEYSLLALLNEIIDDDTTDEATKSVAYEQLAIKLAEVYRHQEVIRGLGSVAAKRELSRERAGSMTLEVFGAPDKEVFSQLLAEDRGIATQYLTSADHKLATIAAEFLAKTGDVHPETEESSLELSDHTMETVRGDLEALFPRLKAFLDQPVDDLIKAKDSLRFFDQALEVVGLTEKGWASELSRGSAASTKGSVKRVRVGENRTPFTDVSIKAVALHEALHARRYQNASEQDDAIKRQALPGNLEAEEGLMTAIEQSVTKERRQAGVVYYLSLGLQLGFDGTPKRNFRDTYEVLWRRAVLAGARVGVPLTDEAVMKAKGATYKAVLRTTRGNSLDARDISYFEGGQKAVKWLNELADEPDDAVRRKKLEWVLSGKFDPTNPTHVKLFEADL